MNSSDDPSKTQRQHELIKFEGLPQDIERRNEVTRWERFLKFIQPWASKAGLASKYGGNLANDFAHTELAKRNNEAEKLGAEAANIAAEKQQKIQLTVTAVNDEIARIFSQSDLPDFAKKLQLANLLAANPKIAEQFEKIESLYSEMSSKYGTRVELRKKELVEPTKMKDVEPLG